MRVVFILGLLSLFYSCREASKTSPVVEGKSSQPTVNASVWNHLSLYHTKGKVKKMVQTTYLGKKVNGNYEKVNLGTRYETHWDQQGVLKEQSYFNSTLKLQTKTNYLSDGKQKWLSAKTTQQTGKLIKIFSFQYDQNGYLKEEIQSTPQHQKVLSLKYKWSTDKKLLERSTWDMKGNLGMKCTYRLNSQGFPIETVYEYDKKKVKIICKTEYTAFDKQSNWINAVETTSKGSIFIHERELIYFP